MHYFKLRALVSVLVFGAVALVIGPAVAQVPSTQPPYNVDLGAVITNAAAAPGTINSAQLNNLDKTGAICTFYPTAITDTPTVVLNIQNYDSASGVYYTIATSGAAADVVDDTPVVVAVHSLQTASLPSGVTAASGIQLSRYWRVDEVLAGSGSTTTATVGCVVIK